MADSMKFILDGHEIAVDAPAPVSRRPAAGHRRRDRARLAAMWHARYAILALLLTAGPAAAAERFVIPPEMKRDTVALFFASQLSPECQQRFRLNLAAARVLRRALMREARAQGFRGEEALPDATYFLSFHDSMTQTEIEREVLAFSQRRKQSPDTCAAARREVAEKTAIGKFLIAK